MKSARHLAVRSAVAVCCASIALTACGSSESEPTSDPGVLDVAATTSIWGDVIEDAFGDSVSVTVLIPADADPHHFEPSTKMAAELESSDLIVANGAGLEAAFGSVIDAAEQTGTPVFTITDHVTTQAGDAHDDADGHDDGDNGDDHDAEPIDPHVWLDPERVAEAVTALAVEFEALGVDDASARAQPFLASLTALDDEIRGRLEPIPADRRVLVTSHDSLGYYAHAYDLDVVDTIVGSVSTDAEPSVAELEDVVAAIDQYRVDAIFVDPGESDRLAVAIADETDREIKVVPLLTDGLGDSADYPAFMRATTELIANGLTQ